VDSIVDSTAFQREAMRSERIRIAAILSLLAVVGGIVIIRAVVVGAPGDERLLLYSSLLLAAMAAYELGMLMAVRRNIRRDRLMPRWLWRVNVVVETLLPTLALLILTESYLFGPYEALVAPAVLSYFFFITLSTLRLKPALAILTGFSSAIGYSIVLVYTLLQYPEPPAGSVPLGRGVYFTYAAFLLVGGWVAAGVARQIRSHVASALDEARRKERVERDMEVARSIQQGLLPDGPPRIPGFDVAGWNRPADETGGDFFYWQPLANGRTGITVADVTGHGIGPAIIASVARAYGRAALTEDADLADVMGRMDTLLSQDLPPGTLVNLIAALVDPESNQVRLLSAGQAPILLYRAETGSVESSKADGVPLGVGLGLGCGTPREIRMAPGDMLVLVTDGFFEWENAQGEQFGVDRLVETIRQASGLAASAVISTLHSEVLEFVDGTSQDDDLTAVIVKREAG
jgi:serine phosphatase RsbU (regulator of sigma subunit)